MPTPDFKFPSPREHYDADACVVWCFDDRFSDLLEAYKKERGFKHADVVECAGGAKALAAPDGADRDFVVNQIKLSNQLHKTPHAILMVHIDCGGYGGSKALGNDHAMEWKHHVEELEKAAAFVRATFPEMETVECCIADFDGVYRV